MEELLNDIVPEEELVKFEKLYNKELADGPKALTYKTTFEYAFCLVRSRYNSDIKRGIALLEDLCTKNPDDKRDYIYYLALGHARLKEYNESIRFCEAFLQIEPNNNQVIGLQQHCKAQLRREGIKGAAMVGGALMAGGAAALGFALLKGLARK